MVSSIDRNITASGVFKYVAWSSSLTQLVNNVKETVKILGGELGSIWTETPQRVDNKIEKFRVMLLNKVIGGEF